MAWIQIDEEIWEHHKFIRLSKMLGEPSYVTVGRMVRLWHFVLRNAWKTADLKLWGDETIEQTCFWTGEKGVFIKALRACNLLDEYVVHGWHKRAGKLVVDRIYNERRKSHAVKRRKLHVNLRKQGATLPNITLPNLTIPNLTNKDVGAEPSKAFSSQAPQEFKKETDIQKIVKGWKILNGLPVEGPDSKSWDKVHFSRHSKSAASMLGLFGDLKTALDAMEFVFDYMKEKKLSCTIETIVKHSDLYREALARSGR